MQNSTLEFRIEILNLNPAFSTKTAARVRRETPCSLPCYTRVISNDSDELAAADVAAAAAAAAAATADLNIRALRNSSAAAETEEALRRQQQRQQQRCCCLVTKPRDDFERR